MIGVMVDFVGDRDARTHKAAAFLRDGSAGDAADGDFARRWLHRQPGAP